MNQGLGSPTLTLFICLQTHLHVQVHESVMMHVCFHSDAVNVPMIPLGLKETKEVDFTIYIQVL